MGKILFDQIGEKFYELGVSKCVLFVMDKDTHNYKDGVAWNGITSITETPKVRIRLTSMQITLNMQASEHLKHSAAQSRRIHIPMSLRSVMVLYHLRRVSILVSRVVRHLRLHTRLRLVLTQIRRHLHTSFISFTAVHVLLQRGHMKQSTTLLRATHSLGNSILLPFPLKDIRIHQ